MTAATVLDMPEREALDELRGDALEALVRGPALALAEGAPVAQARALLLDHRVPAIAVIDDRAQLRGLVTRTDVLAATGADLAVADIMSVLVFSLPATASIERAAALVAYEGVGQIVVTGPAR